MQFLNHFQLLLKAVTKLMKFCAEFWVKQAIFLAPNCKKFQKSVLV